MKAAFYTETGIASDVLRIGELPTPEPGAGEIRVKLKYSGVNPSDVKSRGGTVARSAGLPLVIPHSDGAGVIDTVGEGVSTDRLGERVWVFNGQWNRQYGTAAEFIVLPAQQAVPLPAATSFEEGACLGIPALTAWVAVHHADCSTHTRVLVQGGAGAVGRYAIQFARLRGAFVLATVSSEEKAAYAKSAGADQVINYRIEDVAAQVKALTEDHGVDAVIEVNFSANLLPDIDVLAHGGKIVVYGAQTDSATLPLRRLRGLNATLQFMRVYDIARVLRARAIDSLTQHLAQGELRHQIAQVYPLDRIADAHDAVDSGSAIGNVLIALD